MGTKSPIPRNNRWWICLLLLALVARPATAGVIVLENGMEFEGLLGKIGSLLEAPVNIADDHAIRLIILADDGLRRTYVSYYQITDIRESAPHPLERILIEQRVARAGQRIGAVGSLIRIQPWDEFGRRIVTMRTLDGPIDIIQGITEVTPVYCKVEALQGVRSYIWETRIATSTIPREVLSRILLRQLDHSNADDRLSLVRLYLQAERYRDARNELQTVIDQFPDLADLEQQVRELRQMSVNRLITEIELRQEAGQQQLAWNMLDGFPEEGVAGETSIAVRNMMQAIQEDANRVELVNQRLAEHVAAIANPAQQLQVEAACEEIATELSLATLNRMADYMRLADVGDLEAEQLVSLAISGWLLGSNNGTVNLAVAISLHQVRDLVAEYLISDAGRRREILEELSGLEGATPGYVSLILKHMKPPKQTELQENDTPGLLQLNAPGIQGQADVTYHVQLPPEYDPYRKYPVVMTLNGAGRTPLQQIDWWAGTYQPELSMRTGQASRHGYIVIAPVWHRQYQSEYEFSANEHAAVLYSLRDVCRRFSVDTDRVYLSGHSMGGVAAWDIGLAHPDLWAGVMPIVPRADRYIIRYNENAKLVPLYFVVGELDGAAMIDNAGEFDRYLQRPDSDITVVEFKGRGHEHYHDEVHRLFHWMSYHERDFYRREFVAHTMRAWDNFFWWAELDGFPDSAIVAPAAWPPARSLRPAETEARIHSETNSVHVRSSANNVTIFLSPELVDFEERLQVRINARDIREPIVPSLEVMLEDVRTRSDRLHPFWAKVQSFRRPPG